MLPFIPLLVLGFAGAGMLLRRQPTPVNADQSETSTPASALSYVTVTAKRYEPPTLLENIDVFVQKYLGEIFVTAKAKPPLQSAGNAAPQVPLQNAGNMPRGIRNNNPGNIEAGDNWVGSVGDDGRFVVFSAPEYGIRAIARIFNSYRNRGKISLADIISTWAPPNENNTKNYINFVEKQSGLRASHIVQTSDYAKVIAAMIQMENGIQPYPMSTIQYGVNIA